jgi:hypothetical protein
MGQQASASDANGIAAIFNRSAFWLRDQMDLQSYQVASTNDSNALWWSILHRLNLANAVRIRFGEIYVVWCRKAETWDPSE